MTLRWGFIGLGRVASTVARAFDGAAGNELVAVAGRRHDAAVEFAARVSSGVRAYASAHDLLADDDIDVVYVCSPNDLHREHVIAALRSGRHVLCEKPLASTLAEAEAIHDDARRFDHHLGVGFQYRQHPAHSLLRATLQSDQLGAIRVADVSGCLPALAVPPWYSDPGYRGGGIVPMSGIHRIDLLRYLLDDEVVEVSAMSESFRGEAYDDAMALHLRFARGTLATLRFALDTPFGADRVAIDGTEGSAAVSGTMSQWWSNAPGDVTVTTVSGMRRESFETRDLYTRQIEAFAEHVAGRGAFPGSYDGVQAARVSEALYASAATGSAVTLDG